MLQVAMSGGEVRVVEVPEPVVRPGTVLVRTSHSLISAGTESASIGSGGRRENLVLKAIRNPALVMKVVDRVASHGLKSTAELVKTRVSTEMPSGYSCAGVVVEVGRGRHRHPRRRPRGLRGGRLRQPRLRERGAEESRGPDPGRRLVRGGGLRDPRGHRAPGRAPGRAGDGRPGGRAGPGPPGPDHGADAARGGRRRHRRRRPSRSRGARPGPGPRSGLHRRRARLRGRRPRANGGPRGGRGDRDRGRGRRGAPQQGLRGVPEEGPGRAGRRRPDPHPARQDLQEGDRLPDLDLVRARPLRPRLRGEGPRLPVRLRALDGGPQPRGGAAPGRGGVSPRQAARRRDAPGRERGRGVRLARLGEPADRHPARLPPGCGGAGTARGLVPPDPPRRVAARRPARSASGWSATAGTSARCCCRC